MKKKKKKRKKGKKKKEEMVRCDGDVATWCCSHAPPEAHYPGKARRKEAYKNQPKNH